MVRPVQDELKLAAKSEMKDVAGFPEAVLIHAQEQAYESGHAVHVCRLPESKALFPFAVVKQSDFRFEREKWRPLEACAVTRYGRVILA